MSDYKVIYFLVQEIHTEVEGSTELLEHVFKKIMIWLNFSELMINFLQGEFQLRLPTMYR